MRVPTDFERCIICLDNPIGDWEHVIPHSTGGRLEAGLLCNGCNHKFGGQLVGQLNSDPSIRYAFEALKQQLPSLYRKAQQRAVFIGKASDGSTIRVSNAKGEPRVLSGRGADNTLIQDTRDAQNGLITKLRRAGLPADQIDEYASTFAQLPEDEPLHLPTGDIFVKHPIPQLYPEIGKDDVSDRLLSLMAYEYFSLLVGRKILAPYFDPIRHYIVTGTETHQLTVGRFRGEKYSPYHVLDLDIAADSVTVNIRFFRFVIFSVTFHGFEHVGPDTVYLEDLEASQSLIALTKAEARQDHYYVQV